jgi:hypothetical protein
MLISTCETPLTPYDLITMRGLVKRLLTANDVSIQQPSEK